jgi:hydroxypyruvate isomerase
VSITFSACVEMIFNDRPFLDRLHGVAAAGLPAFEFWRIADKDIEAIRAKQDQLGLTCAAFSASGGVPLVDSSRQAEFLTSLREAIRVARELGCKTLIVTTGNTLPDRSRKDQHASIVAALREAAKLCEDARRTLALEPLNVLVDHAGYYLETSAEGFQIVDEVGSPAVKLLYDIYHQQITEGNLISTVTANVAKIGHLHVADVPGRHEPGTGEINYRNVFKAIETAGYQGYVGLEYRPADDAAITLARVQGLTDSPMGTGR